MPSRRRARTKNLGTNLADVQRRMRYLERRPVRTKLQKKVVTASNIAPETITADEVNFGTAVITTETDVGNVVVENPKDGLLIVSSTNGSSSVYSDTDAAFIPITDTAAQATADTALEESEAAAAAAIAAEAEAAAAAADAAAAEVSAQASFDEAAASAAAAEAAETAAATSAADAAAAEIAAQEAFDQATASATAANDAEIAAQESADAATGSAGAADAAAAQAQEAADQAIASAAAAQEAFDEAQAAAQSAADADAAAIISAEESEAAAIAAAAAQEAADAAALDAADAAEVAGNALDESTAAKDSALAATESANKKNSVFRAPASAYTAPTYNPAGQPKAEAVGDVWFDTTPLTNDNGAGGAKPKRWNGTTWEAFGLSYAAITSLDADVITAGTITGRTVKTSASGNRIELADTDVLKFWKDDATLVGSIQPGLGNEGLVLTAGSGGSSIYMTGSGWADDSAIILSTSGNSGSIVMSDGSFTDPDTGEVTDTGGIIMTGNDLTLQGSSGWTIKDAISEAVIYGQGGDISMQGGGAAVSLSAGDIQLSGNLVLGFGTYVQGTGAPTAAATDGTIIFKYT